MSMDAVILSMETEVIFLFDKGDAPHDGKVRVLGLLDFSRAISGLIRKDDDVGPDIVIGMPLEPEMLYYKGGGEALQVTYSISDVRYEPSRAVIFTNEMLESLAEVVAEECKGMVYSGPDDEDQVYSLRLLSVKSRKVTTVRQLSDMRRYDFSR